MVAKLAVGYICAVAASTLSGSWQAAVKSNAITKHNLHPAVLNLQFMFGFFVLSWVALFDSSQSFNFTWWGVLSAVLFDTSMCLNIAVSFPILGIAVGSGIASSIAIITSFVWSALILDQSMRSVGMTCFGILVVVLGVNLIIFTGRYFTVPVKVKIDKNNKENKISQNETSPLIAARNRSGNNSNDDENDDNDIHDEEDNENEVDKKDIQDELAVDKNRFIIGVSGGFIAGIFGGSFLVPNMSCCADADTEFLPSFGIGCIIVGPVMSLLTVYVTQLLENDSSSSTSSSKLCPSNEVLLETSPWGFLAGGINALAIILITKAMDDIDYVVATTISQCSIFVTGLWGWIIFKEFDEKTWGVACFFASAFILVGGATIVAYWGTTK